MCRALRSSGWSARASGSRWAFFTAVFQNEVTQNRSFIYSLVEGGGAALRQRAGCRLSQHRARGAPAAEHHPLSDDRKRFISVALIRPPATVDYYYEDSDDPFAEITPQLEHALARWRRARASPHGTT